MDAARSVLILTATRSVAIQARIYGKALSKVHFPIGSTLSLMSVMSDDGMIEVASIGQKGCYDLPLCAELTHSLFRVVAAERRRARCRLQRLPVEVEPCEILAQAVGVVRFGFGLP